MNLNDQRAGEISDALQRSGANVETAGRILGVVRKLCADDKTLGANLDKVDGLLKTTPAAAPKPAAAAATK